MPMGRYQVVGTDMTCQFCGQTDFTEREIKLNTTGLSLFDLDWLNKAAEGLVCSTCGYVHMFLKKDAVQQVGD